MRLEVNNKIAQLPPDASISIKIHNPAFHKLGTYSEPFNLVRHLNRATMQYAEDEDNLSETSQLFKLYLGNELFMEGELGVNDTVGGYKCYLKSGKSSIARILKESYLDGEINGQSWGEAVNGITDINASVNGVYPAKKFTVAPVKLDDFTINDWIDGALTTTDIATGKVTPMVYVRHIIDRINQASGLLVGQNDFSILNDFNRLCLFAPRKSADDVNGLKLFREWMPRLSASDFITDLQDRFNIIAFFSPFGREVDYVHFDSIFSNQIIDWTDKYIRDEKIPPYQQGVSFLRNDGEDEDVLSPREIEEKYDITEVPTYDDLTKYGEVQKVLDVERYFVPQQYQVDNSLTRPFYFDTIPIFGDVIPYRALIEEVDESTDELSNDDTTANQDNLILSMFFLDDTGKVYDNASILSFEARVNSGTATLVTKLEIRETINGVSQVVDVLGTHETTIGNANYEVQELFFLLDKTGEWERIRNKDGNYISGTYLTLTFYCNAATAGRVITTRLGYINQPGYQPYTIVYVDQDRTIYRELGVIGNYEQGNLSALRVHEVEPESKVLYNAIGESANYFFQMPVSDIDPKLEQKDYAYTIYRGIINDERDAGKTAPYCNFDIVDLEMNDYQSRVTVGDTPDLSLRYNGEKGTAEVLHQKRLNWFRDVARPVRKVFQLSKNDLQNIKMYHRIRVKNKLYLIDIISVKANANGELSESTIDMYLL